MIAAGLAKKDVEGEQMRMLAERTAKLLKKGRGELKSFFGLDTTFEFETAVSDFASAMTVLLNFELVEDLGDRVELLKDAIDVVKGATPDAAAGSKGNLLGSTLAHWLRRRPRPPFALQPRPGPETES
eukprot:9468519-Pyramimonas_sp.AAC.2